MIQPIPDYKAALFRLADKIRRQADYYRRAAKTRRKLLMQSPDLEDVCILTAESESLERCAKDMDFAFERATDHLPTEDIAAIIALPYAKGCAL